MVWSVELLILLIGVVVLGIIPQVQSFAPPLQTIGSGFYFVPRGSNKRLIDHPLAASPQQESEILEWTQSLKLEGEPQLLITDVQDGISLSIMFWNVVADLKGTALFCFPDAPDGFNILLKSYADVVNNLDLGVAAKAYSYNQSQDTRIAPPCPALSVTHHTNGVQVRDTPEVYADEMRRWVDQVIVQSKVCPFTTSTEWAGTGLPGVTPGKVGYPLCRVTGSDATATCAVLASFWNNVVDMLNQPPSKLSTILLCAPHVAVNDHEAFARICNAVVQTLQVVNANSIVSLVFFHPLYQRESIEPNDRQIHGHLPPSDWLSGYLKLLPHQQESPDRKKVVEVSQKDLDIASNAQRQSPFFAINVLRAEQVAKAESVVPWQIIELPGRRLRVSGAPVYATNIWRLATKREKIADPVTGYQYYRVRN